MADVVILDTFDTLGQVRRALSGPFWKSTTTGYVHVQRCDSGTTLYSICVFKTTDSGATWTIQDEADQPGGTAGITAQQIAHGCFWDGTTIHFSWISNPGGEILYASFNTSTDQWTSAVVVATGLTVGGSTASQTWITKADGGNLYITANWNTGAASSCGFYRSTNSGGAWSSRNHPWDSGAAITDRMMLSPGEAADTNDIIGIYYDQSAGTISRQLYDDSANSWGSRTTIFTTSTDLSFATTAYVWDCVRDRFNGGTLVASWNDDDDQATGDCVLARVTESSITALGDIVTNSDDCYCVALLVNNNNGDIYAAYLGSSDGSQTWTATVQCFFKISTNGGTSFGTQQTYGTENDDLRGVSLGSYIGSGGGRVMPLWIDDDDDTFSVNDGNDLEIAAAGVTHSGAAVLAASASVTLPGRIKAAGAAALAAAGTVAPGARVNYKADTALTGSAAIAGGARITAAAAATLAGTGEMANGAGLRSQNSAALTASATVAAAASVSSGAQALLEATAALSPAARLTTAGAAALAASAAVAPGAGIRSQNQAALSATAQISPAGGMHINAAAALAAAASMSDQASVKHQAALALQAAATLAAEGHITAAAAAVLAGAATMDAAGRTPVRGSALLQASAALAALAVTKFAAAAVLAATATMTPTARLLLANVQMDYEIARAWALVYDVDDTTLLGVLPFIQPAFTLRQLNAAGYFELQIPETHESAALVAYGRYVRLYYSGSQNNPRFRGIIEDFETPATENGVLMRRVWGGSLALELLYENTYQDIVIAGASASSGFAAVLANASGWTATATGTYETQTGRYGFKSLLEAARRFAAKARAYIRETWTARELELKNTSSDSGLVLGNVKAHGAMTPAEASIVPLRSTPSFRTQGRVFNRIVPIGQGEQGEPVTLQRSTRSGVLSRFVRKARVSDALVSQVLSQEGFESAFTAFGENRYALGVLVANGTGATIGNVGGQQLPAIPGFGTSIIAGWEGKPPKGQPGFKVDITISGPTVGGIVSLEGVDQVDPVLARASNSGTSTTPSVTVTSDVNSYVIAFLVLRTIGTPSITPGSGVTVIAKLTNSAFDEDQVTLWEKTAGASSTTFNWTISPSQTWEAYAWSFNPALTYYIEDATSIAAHGPGKPRVKVLTLMDLTVDRIDDQVAIANALFDAAAEELARSKDPTDIVMGQPDYLPDDTILPGDALRFLFVGVVELEDGSRRIWKQWDTTFIIMAIKENWLDGRRQFDLTIATSIQEALGDLSAEVGDLSADVDLVAKTQVTRA